MCSSDLLRTEIKTTTSDYDREKLEERLAKLAGGVAVVNIGSVTETELKEKRERVIDAINATKQASQEGIVAGGEITLLYIANNLKIDTLGGKILIEALKVPFKRILENSGLDYAEIREKMAGKTYPYGVDVIDGEIKNLIEAGIIDPAAVTKSALESAVSISCIVSTTSTLITDITKEEK